MTDERQDRLDLRPEERRFVERMNAAFEPRPMHAARRMALDARIRERIERSRWSAILWPGLAAAALVVALVWAELPVARSGNGQEPTVARVEPQAPNAWERRLFYGDVSGPTLDENASEALLPPDYAAIESLFFDG